MVIHGHCKYQINTRGSVVGSGNADGTVARVEVPEWKLASEIDAEYTPPLDAG
jgi:hypothetical protein